MVINVFVMICFTLTTSNRRHVKLVAWLNDALLTLFKLYGKFVKAKDWKK